MLVMIPPDLCSALNLGQSDMDISRKRMVTAAAKPQKSDPTDADAGENRAVAKKKRSSQNLKQKQKYDQ